MILTDCHIYAFRLNASKKLPSEIDPFKVHVHPASDFKPFPRHHLEGFMSKNQKQCARNEVKGVFQ